MMVKVGGREEVTQTAGCLAQQDWEQRYSFSFPL